MSYATGTTFYNLPQTVGTDKRDWFDENQAFADVDAALHTAVTGQAADAEAISAIQTQLASDEADIAALQSTTSNHTTQIATLSTATSQNTSDIGDLRSDAEDMITAYNEGSAATSTRAYAIGDYFIYNDVLYKATAAIDIGDTIVPNTNCEATNVTTEIAGVIGDLADVNGALHNSIIVATSEAGQTWAEQLAELKEAYLTLTTSQRRRCVIASNYNLYSMANYSQGNFMCIFTLNDHITCDLLSLQNESKLVTKVYASNFTRDNESAETNTYSAILLLF